MTPLLCYNSNTHLLSSLHMIIIFLRKQNHGSDCCEWEGVKCDTISGHVIALDLSCSNLEGQLHPNTTLFSLTHLQQLNLAYNNFDGSSIPSGIGDLVKLTHLNLSEASFRGDIPSTISHLTKLVSLDLGGNRQMRLHSLTWEKLVHNATNLRHLWLDYVNMSSIKESSLSLLTNLSSSLLSLSLSDTELRGNLSGHILCLPNLQQLILCNNPNLKGHQLPKSNWSTHLRYLTLSGCNFGGLLPSSLFSLTQLSYLNLSANKLVGPIPSQINKLSKLEALVLFSNNLNGTIPEWCYSLPSLLLLDLSGNLFTGSISDFSSYSLEILSLSNNKLQGHFPNSIFKLQNLSILSLSSNNLSGLVDFHQFSKLPSLFYLDLSDNLFSGSIGDFSAPSLHYLFLSNNKHHGDFPNSIFQLQNLTELRLSSNNLSGLVDFHQFSKLPSLYLLDLSDNLFTGSIGDFSARSLECLFLSNNKLQDNFPNSIFELQNLTELSLSSNNLSGLVDFHQFSKLKNLSSLDLSHNSFLYINFNSSVDYIIPNLEYLYLSSCNINSFPKFLARLQYLKDLDLSHNKIRGSISKWFHDKLLHSWENIYRIDLSFNKLQGDLPIPPNGIQFFIVSNNELTGNIPSTMCNASYLSILNLAHNNLTGLIPQCLGTLPYLGVLDLQMNNLRGSMPQNFSKRNAFETIKLNGNQLEGLLPLSLSHCTSLQVLDLGNNNLDDTFPHWLDTLQKLQVLSLRSNKFHGVITCSSTKHPFPMLRIFDVSNNNFSGPLPASCIKNFQGMMNVNDSQTSLKYMGSYFYYNDSVMVVMKGLDMELEIILTAFTTIDLSKNIFEGEIPKVMGDLHSLKGLNLSHNRITGSIPLSLANLRNLEWLDLSWNQLMGKIPMALTNLNFLAVLNPSQNHFEGTIPTGKQFNTFENESFIGNPMLCGLPLSKSCTEIEDWEPHSTFENEESVFGWKGVGVGYACGALFGMLLGCNVFMTGKPQWLARLVKGVLNEGVKRRAHANRRGRA